MSQLLSQCIFQDGMALRTNEHRCDSVLARTFWIEASEMHTCIGLLDTWALYISDKCLSDRPSIILLNNTNHCFTLQEDKR